MSNRLISATHWPICAVVIAEPGDVAYSQNFEEGPGGFKGGEVTDGGTDGSKGYSFGPKGCSIWSEP